MNEYLDLFLVFAKMGVMTFGGGMAMLPILQREVVEHLRVKPSTVNGILDRMEEKGLISRLPDPLDNRQIIVSLSPKGEKAIEAFRKKVIQATARMLELLGPDDSQEFLRLQRKLVTNLIPR